MFFCNDQHWPLVIHEFAGLQTLAEHEQSLLVWNSHFSRGESFVIIRLFRDEESLVHPEGAAKLTKAWLRDGAAEAIKASVTAMMNIVPESAYERMKHMSVEAVFGVPGGVFNSSQDAAEWFITNLRSTETLQLELALKGLDY
uniref:hypothetical protein n=1 Tax=Cellvibrio fontiphilus TaxID=1815559 RepID=UPI002B4BB27C|nr:hypothetical protein [Cellvibrio fontiphilus]